MRSGNKRESGRAEGDSNWTASNAEAKGISKSKHSEQFELPKSGAVL
jgi:hypothetical protein